MKEERLKLAFLKIKEDIMSLGNEISQIRADLLETNQLMKQINEEITQLKLEKLEKTAKNHEKKTPTQEQEIPAYPATPTHLQEIEGLKTQNLDTSIGNQGVPTDKQTNQQTNQHIFRQIISRKFPSNEVPKLQKEQITQEKVVPSEPGEKPIQDSISEASDLLDSLDAIKKEIRRKFKRITKQEMLVFSTVYQLEEQNLEPDYKKIALKLGLSESSIRDYTHRLINKGIPLTKEKLDNKKILLHISPELKKIASLDTIIKLREI